MTWQKIIYFTAHITCNQTPQLHFRRMLQNRSSNQRLFNMRTSEKPQNIHSDEAAATNQSVLKDVLETTRLQDTFPSSSIAVECVPQVAAAHAQHVWKSVSTGRHPATVWHQTHGSGKGKERDEMCRASSLSVTRIGCFLMNRNRKRHSSRF